MKAYIVLECNNRHRWYQTVDVEKTGHCIELKCSCGNHGRAEQIELSEIIRHCPECGKRFARIVQTAAR